MTGATFVGAWSHWYVYNWYPLVPTFPSGPPPSPYSYAWDSFTANECYSGWACDAQGLCLSETASGTCP